MTRVSLWVTLLSGAFLAAGCGARTSEDELLAGPAVPGVGGGSAGQCCATSSAPGCTDKTIEACVCAIDAQCCSAAWDGVCVAEVDAAGCGKCSATGGNGGTGGVGGDGGGFPTGGVAGGTGGVLPTGGVGGTDSSCCFAHAGTGCGDNQIAACVCSIDTFCCNTSWDAQCAVQATQLCGANCGTGGAGGSTGGFGGTGGSTGGAPSGGAGGSTGGFGGTGGSTGGAPSGGAGGSTGGSGGTGASDCCVSDGQPGCTDFPVQACVCKNDPWCCQVGWDETCSRRAQFECGTSCGLGGGGVGGGANSCCATSNKPSCGTDGVEKCVCGMDPYCCHTAWDSICVNEANGSCGGCQGGTGGAGGTGGSGGTGGISQADCEQQMPATCAGCACSSCLGAFNDCVTSGQCAPFALCLWVSGCGCF